MIKSFKIFEKVNIPEVGDYAIMQIQTTDRGIDNFVCNTIGKISDIQWSTDGIVQRIGVIYTDVPNKLQWWFSRMGPNRYKRNYTPNRLSQFAKTKEELEMILNANKYNL